MNERIKALKLEALLALVDISNDNFFNGEMMMKSQRAAFARLAMIDIPLPYTRARYSDNRLGMPGPLLLDIRAISTGTPVSGLRLDDAVTSDGRKVRDRVVDELTGAIRKSAEEKV